MRMDQSAGATAADLVNAASEQELADVIFQFGEERHSRRIARTLVGRAGPIQTTGELASLVRRAVPTRGWQRIDPATRTFQALRIWVNGELDGLDRFVQNAARPARRERAARGDHVSLARGSRGEAHDARADPRGHGIAGVDEEAGDCR